MMITLYVGQPFSDLYVSDADGLIYTSVVERVRRRSAHIYDFYNQRGIDGAFVLIFCNTPAAAAAASSDAAQFS
jgi:hypothetical protein